MKFLYFLLVIILFSSCQTFEVFEKSNNFSTQQWNGKDAQKFEFDVNDTAQAFNHYLVIRHTDNYPYKNIWLEIIQSTPLGTDTLRKEFTLADNEKWLGTTIDGITDHRILFNKQLKINKKGKCSFTLKHIMREDPLPQIMSVGVRVSKD